MKIIMMVILGIATQISCNREQTALNHLNNGDYSLSNYVINGFTGIYSAMKILPMRLMTQ
jgi:hypothetical protein